MSNFFPRAISTGPARFPLQKTRRSVPKFADSLLEGRVKSELVSEIGFRAPREINADFSVFMGR